MPIEEYEADLKKARESGYSSGFSKGVAEAVSQLEFKVVRHGYANTEMADSGLAKLIKDAAERIRKHFIAASVRVNNDNSL
jgi:flagellar biosynthesis/type III secretory pathway protein FliH